MNDTNISYEGLQQQFPLNNYNTLKRTCYGKQLLITEHFSQVKRLTNNQFYTAHLT